MCQQMLELDKTIDVGKETSNGILKGKFALNGTAGKIAREQVHEQCKRDVHRLKA